MQPLIKKLFGRDRVVCVLFFGVFYLFLWLCIKPHLIYHYFEISRKAGFFETGWLFLQESLSCPGGPIQYPAAFFTQLCFFSWLGALCITLIAWAIYRLSASLTTVAADSPWRFICYVPAVLVLMICSRYESPLSTAMAVLAVVFFSVLYEKILPHLGAARMILFLIVCGFLYYLAGSIALAFVALAALREFFDRRNPVFGVLYLLLGMAVCWLLGFYVFELGMREVYLHSSPFIATKHNLDKEKWARIFEGALFVVLPVIVLLISLGRMLAGTIGTSRPSKQSVREKSPAAKEIPEHFYRGEFKWIMQISLLVLILVPSFLFSFDRKAKSVIQVSDYTCRRMWPEVLATARQSHLKRYFPFCNHAVNRALYYTGRFGDEMFAYPQDFRVADLVFCLIEGGNVVFMERAETCLELGLVNVAEKLAHEFLEGADDSPYILKQLALINIVKGRTETARVFLKALSKNLIYAKEAKGLLRRLESDPLLESDQRIRQLRSVMMTEDYGYTSYKESPWLTELLRRNKYNKMAFEYLMAHYMLTRQLDKFVENLPRLDDFGYDRIPQQYQEAIVLYIGTTRKSVDLGDRLIDAETLQEYNEINKIGKQFDNDMGATWRALAPRFNRTYFFYFTFGYSGITPQNMKAIGRPPQPPKPGPIAPPPQHRPTKSL
jgi:hypothetical protein